MGRDRTNRTPLLAIAAALLTGGLLPATAAAAAQPWQPDAPAYGVAVTNDVPITMSDGRILRAQIETPTDPTTGRPAAGPFPVILSETPYGKSVMNPVPTYFVSRGYLGVSVDVAGTGGSQGTTNLFSPSEAADSAQVIRWAAGLAGSSGEVGMYGGSYLAIDQLFAAAAVGPNSPLKAIFPIDASVDPYRDLFTSGGVVNAESSLGLIAAYFGTRTVTPPFERPGDLLDALKLSLEHAAAGIPFELTTGLDVLLNGSRRFDDAYWRERAPETVLPKLVANGVAAYLVGGQYDVFQRGEPQLYSQLQNIAAGRPQFAPMAAGQAATAKYQLLFGPWDHSTAGGADAGINERALQWFDQWLKHQDTGILDTRAPLHVIEPGGARYDTADYPDARLTPTRYFLGPQSSLSTTAPGASGGSDTLLFTGASQLCTRSTQQWSAGIIPASACGATEPDPLPAPVQLTYTSTPLDHDTRLGGPVGLTLHTSAVSQDTLYTATVEDVAPDGTARALSSGAQLGSLRAVDPARSWRAPDGGYLMPYHPLTAASQQSVPLLSSTRYDIEIRPVFATVPAGHRLRIVLGTGDLPHLLPPPATGLGLFGLSQVQHSADALSWLDLPVVG